MAVKEETAQNSLIEALFKVGAHLGYSRSRRHASMKSLIFGTKGKTDILDLTGTSPIIEESLAYMSAVGAHGKTVLFVGGKPEVRDLVREAAASIGMPYVAGRWIGGTLSNFSEIKKRIARLHALTEERDSGASAKKYTKKERVLIGREIARLEENFSGIAALDRVPDVLVVVDTRFEAIAVKEARTAKVPVVGIMNSDCDLSLVAHPVPGNDASRESVTFFLGKVVEAYQEGQKGKVAEEAKAEGEAVHANNNG